MANKIIMPKLGLTMKEGKIIKWYKKENEGVKAGEKLFSIETDKLTNDVEAKEDGVLRKVIRDEGEVVPCLEPVGIIGSADEDISALLSEIDLPQVEKEKKKEDKDVAVEGKRIETKRDGRVRISPVAKKLALEHNIDISEIVGSGPNGRIVLEDVEKYIEKKEKIKTTPAAAKLAKELDVDISQIDKADRIRKEDIYKFHRQKAL